MKTLSASASTDGSPGGVPVRRPNAARAKRPKSEITRRRLCHATLELIERKPLRQIKVADIAEAAGVSTSAFYLYFADVEAAVLALLADLAADIPDLAAHVRAITRAETEPGVRALLAVYLAYWEANYALLRVRNLTADEGEPRFREMRGLMLGPLLDALTEKLVEMRGSIIGSTATPAMALAAVMAGSMERLASLVRVTQARPELARAPLIDAEVVLLCEMLRGPGGT